MANVSLAAARHPDFAEAVADMLEVGGSQVDFDSCVRKTDLFQVFQEHAWSRAVRLINVLPHFVNQRRDRIKHDSVDLYHMARRHSCIVPEE